MSYGACVQWQLITCHTAPSKWAVLQLDILPARWQGDRCLCRERSRACTTRVSDTSMVSCRQVRERRQVINASMTHIILLHLSLSHCRNANSRTILGPFDIASDIVWQTTSGFRVYLPLSMDFSATFPFIRASRARQRPPPNDLLRLPILITAVVTHGVQLIIIWILQGQLPTASGIRNMPTLRWNVQ
ncbi:hypothetical protein BC628DRAFT_107851 [Trametes gibbosa]|nr:hypothetical protein BC628DRAFT_616903 [Trametes gibbosa]KAI0828280.1 hypothetical protein BC628DRAFT_107851 [Trametes gibbosa]